MTDQKEDEEIDASGSYTTYLEYNKVLRTWFVAFGVGGPALLLANATVTKRLTDAGCLRAVAALFFVGVASQVLGAFINKLANWYVHSAYSHISVDRSAKHHVAEWVANQFWIDIAVDLVTIASFGIATATLLDVLTAP
jgi:hypothetical protein